MITKCRKAFDTGKAKRALYPLEPSTYKLLEAYRDWQRQYDGLNLIESALEDKINIPDDYQLGGWTGADWRGELKRLPEDLAEDLGYRILPGVMSLNDYASPTPETVRLATRAKKQASGIINMCEQYRPSIARTTKHRNATIERISAARFLVIQVLMMIEDSFAMVNLPLSGR
jgi:hypothetical protein